MFRMVRGTIADSVLLSKVLSSSSEIDSMLVVIIGVGSCGTSGIVTGFIMANYMGDLLSPFPVGLPFEALSGLTKVLSRLFIMRDDCSSLTWKRIDES